MSAGFTPGPWMVNPAHPFENAPAMGGGRIEAVLITQLSSLSAHAKANAHLIAAAPELYALLEELVDIEGPQPGTATWAKKVDAALAKARGEQS